jgi:hypothetical protein
MSRYDWGKAHPEIDRLRPIVDGARTAVVGHHVGTLYRWNGGRRHRYQAHHEISRPPSRRHPCSRRDRGGAGPAVEFMSTTWSFISAAKWDECAAAITNAFPARVARWDGIVAAIDASD